MVVHVSDIDHTPGVAQRWPEVDADVGAWVESIVAGTAAVLGGRFVGMYLHGSLAMGCYYRPKADLDVIGVCDGPLSAGTRRLVARSWLEHSQRRPTTGDLEVSLLRLRDSRVFRDPCRYEVHFGPGWAETIGADEFDYGCDRTDEDLAAHLTVVGARGIPLAGPAVTEVVGPVPHEAYLASIESDLDWALDRLPEAPVYGVLNACRVVRVRTGGAGTVPSKEEAGRWALRSAPAEHLPLIGQCLDCYRSSAPMTPAQCPTHGHDWDLGRLEAFADWCRRWR